jgi:hypothetical protein
MIRKFVLAFLLFFFSSVSYSSNTYFSSFFEASANCQSEVNVFNPLVDQSLGYYQCDYTKFSNGRENFALWYYKKSYLGDSRVSTGGNSRTCNLPDTVSVAVTDINWTNSCTPACGENFHLNLAGENGIFYPAQSCVSNPVCTLPKVLNDVGDSCIDKPVCTLPQILNSSQTACIDNPCSENQVLDSFTNQCVASKTCPDGSKIPSSDICPTSTFCPDGSVKPKGGVCPPPSNPPSTVDCGGGVTVQVPFSCPPAQQPPSCPSGQVSGYLNGAFVCVDGGGSSSSTSSTSSGSTSGSTSGDTSGSTSTSSGSTSGSTSGDTSGSTSTSSGSTSGSTSGDTSGSTTSGSTSGSTTSGSTTSSGSTSGSTTSGSTSGSTTSSGSTSGSTTSGSTSGSTTSGSTTSSGSTSGSTTSGSTVLTCVDGHPTDVNGFCSGGSGGTTTSSGGGDCPLGKHREIIGTYADGSSATSCILDSCPAGQVYESAWHICVTPSDFPCMDGQAKVNGICPPQSCGQHEYLSGGSCLPVQPVICVDGSTVYPPFACPPDNNPPPSCPQNQCSGYFNGSFVCVNCSGTSSGSTSGSTSTSSGSTSGSTTSSGSGSGGSTSTSTTSSGGSTSTSTSTTSSGSSGSSNGIDSQGIIDAVKGLGGSGNSKTVKTGDKGGFGTAADTALTQAKTDLDNKMAEVKSRLKEFKPDLSGGSGALPVFNFGQVKGVNLKFDLNDHSDSLSIVSSAVFFLASVMAFRIVLGG